jgi:hypothetical protein
MYGQRRLYIEQDGDKQNKEREKENIKEKGNKQREENKTKIWIRDNIVVFY